MDAKDQELFDQAKQIVFLTGAGVSTASGIPDFRSANGLYTQNHNAEYYLSHRYFETDPDGFYEFCKICIFPMHCPIRSIKSRSPWHFKIEQRLLPKISTIFMKLNFKNKVPSRDI